MSDVAVCSSGPKRIPQPRDRLAIDAYDIESTGLRREPRIRGEKTLRGEIKPALFVHVDSDGRIPESPISAIADLDEHETVLVCRDDVEFTEAAREIGLDDTEALAPQKLSCLLFASVA